MYPKLIVDLNALKNNAKIIKELCDKYEIKLTAVVKVYHANLNIIKVLREVNINSFASSRISQLKKIKNEYKDAKTLLIRIPMISELNDLVKYVDSTLISSKETLIKLNDIAKKNNKIQNVIIMQDLGDLREGIIDQQELVDLACFTEQKLSNIYLEGIGTNLTCYGSIRPTVKNLNVLSLTKQLIEEKINRKLDIVSGGATTSVELLLDKNMPKSINNLRIGGLFTTPMYIKEFKEWNKYLPELKNVFTIEAEVIEVNEKPTYPIGEIVVDGFGQKQQYQDRGIRKRIIIALGKNDIGSYLQLYPEDKESFILGGSSDHIIIDVEDSKKNYKVGDIIKLDLDYESIMIATQSEYFDIIYK